MIIIRYLKKVILPALESENKVEKIHVKHTATEAELQRVAEAKTKAARKATSSSLHCWLWRIPPQQPDPAQPPPQRPSSNLAADVGFGEDWSFLNKRRERAREKKTRKLFALVKAMNKKEKEQARHDSRRPSVLRATTRTSVNADADTDFASV